MASVRDKKGNIVRGSGSELTEKQQSFMDRVYEEGIENAGKIATDIGYTNYYRDRRTQGTAFYREIMKFVDLEAKSIEAAKGTNITKLIAIRDTAMVNGDMKTAMDAIKILNDMQGYKAPVKVEQTKLDITATIDLTKKPEEDNMLDISYEDAD
jgi:hypothetical protein